MYDPFYDVDSFMNCPTSNEYFVPGISTLLNNLVCIRPFSAKYEALQGRSLSKAESKVKRRLGRTLQTLLSTRLQAAIGGLHFQEGPSTKLHTPLETAEGLLLHAEDRS